jgi:hypothetical protein
MKDQNKQSLTFAIRKFVFGSFRVFANIESRSNAAQIEDRSAKDITFQTNTVLLEGSRQFRDQLANLLSDIDLVESIYENQNGLDSPSNSCQQEYDLAAYLVTTWHLCEIFFLNHTNSASLETANWLKVRFLFLSNALHL